MRLADDRHDVMLAMALEPDVFQDHHVVIAFDFLEGALEIVLRVLVIAAEPVLERLRHALGGVQQALA